jgi:membrane-bound metal-dependent hydrolase YbcI (DUF457 family)
MPFTPFHFGPGLAIKSAVPRAFSWTTFIAAQILIDFETVYYWLHHRYPRHHFFHSFAGATLAGLTAACCYLIVIRVMSVSFPSLTTFLFELPLDMESEFSTSAVLWGGLIGGMSHPLLDAIVHPDVHPFLPFSNHNPLFGLLAPGRMEILCMVAGALGLVVLRINTGSRRHRDTKTEPTAIRNR